MLNTSVSVNDFHKFSGSNKNTACSQHHPGRTFPHPMSDKICVIAEKFWVGIAPAGNIVYSALDNLQTCSWLRRQEIMKI